MTRFLTLEAVRFNRICGNGRAEPRTLGFSGEIIDNILADSGEYALQNDGDGVVKVLGNGGGWLMPSRLLL